MARVGGDAERQPPAENGEAAALLLLLLLVRLTVMDGDREVVGGRDFARAKSKWRL